MTRYLSLAEFWYLAEHVTGINAATLIKASRVELADSALHAPQAGFGDTDFYPDAYDKAAVLACRIAWNHPLPDGNKRAAWACLVLFIDLNDGSWNDEHPDTDDAVEAMLAVAAREVDEQRSPTGFANVSPSEPERRMPPNNPEPEGSSSLHRAGKVSTPPTTLGGHSIIALSESRRDSARSARTRAGWPAMYCLAGSGHRTTLSLDFDELVALTDQLLEVAAEHRPLCYVTDHPQRSVERDAVGHQR